MHELLPLLLLVSFIVIPLALVLASLKIRHAIARAVVTCLLLIGGYKCLFVIQGFDRDANEFYQLNSLGWGLSEIQKALEDGKHAELLELLQQNSDRTVPGHPPDLNQVLELDEAIRDLNKREADVRE